ncbi:MAG: arylesterase [Sulfuritalea sp.]|nr:arylesterase [Sulfuritalea sp.]
MPVTIARGVLAAFVILTFAVACSGTKKETALPAGSKVLALGDSLTAPHGVKPGEDWPTLLGQKTGWAVINAGISGNTSAQALDRLPGLLDEHQPQLVLVSLGGNDMLRKLPQEQTVTNLGRMLDLARASGAKTVLLATPKPSLAGAVFNNLAPADFYADVAKDKKVPLIKDALPEVLSDTALKSDQLHPNAAGHAQIGELIYAELKRIGFAR